MGDSQAGWSDCMSDRWPLRTVRLVGLGQRRVITAPLRSPRPTGSAIPARELSGRWSSRDGTRIFLQRALGFLAIDSEYGAESLLRNRSSTRANAGLLDPRLPVSAQNASRTTPARPHPADVPPPHPAPETSVPGSPQTATNPAHKPPAADGRCSQEPAPTHSPASHRRSSDDPFSEYHGRNGAPHHGERDARHGIWPRVGHIIHSRTK